MWSIGALQYLLESLAHAHFTQAQILTPQYGVLFVAPLSADLEDPVIVQYGPSSTYTIPSVNSSTDGTYTCIAVNDEGYTASSYNITGMIHFITVHIWVGGFWLLPLHSY